MARVKMTTCTNCVRSGKRHHGFTLAELIVVLAIIAILAAAGTFAAVGYINRSKYDQNTQNAITVYQVAQTAITQKTDNGTISSWVKESFGNDVFTTTELDSITEPNQSYHKLNYVHLTYNPGREHPDSDKLYDLLYALFY